ncbi:acyltransferase family protein [Streptomyces abyssalis]|uniref:acyltransferase family protein n=1 Tax=Streptomyces abyssalis TaxID=933944 RepID=UPI000D19B16E|nr:acyltransferase family protein [Streptomyces abyssalis]
MGTRGRRRGTRERQGAPAVPHTTGHRAGHTTGDEAGHSAGSAPRPRKARDPHWDNVRFLSGTLVLVGHIIEPRGDIEGLRWLYLVSWAMRVPVFVIVAGYFSSAGPLGRRELRQLTEAVLAPYLLIGLVHTLEVRLLEGHWKFFTSHPAWGLWFLLSLFIWRMLLPYLAELRYPLPTTVAAALAVGYLDDFTTAFSAARTVAFLPFFVLGWELRQGLADQLMHARWSRHAAVCVLTATAVTVWFLRSNIDPSWLGMHVPYQDTAYFDAMWAWGQRGAVLVCGMLIALSFIRLAPKRRLPFLTYLGAGGLFIYLLHPLVLRALFHFAGLGWVGPWPEQLAMIAFGCALAAVLASPPVQRLAGPLVRPRMPWLYAPERPADPVDPVDPAAPGEHAAPATRHHESAAPPRSVDAGTAAGTAGTAGTVTGTAGTTTGTPGTATATPGTVTTPGRS